MNQELKRAKENQVEAINEEEVEKAYILKRAGTDYKCQAIGKNKRPCNWIWRPRVIGKEPVKCPRCQSHAWRGAPVEDGQEAPYKIPVIIIELECQEPTCGHIWTPQDPTRLPIKCPRCGSWDWKGDDE